MPTEKGQTMDGESLAFVLLRFDSGVIGSFEVCSSGGNWKPSRPMFSVEGSLGELVIDGDFKLRLYNAQHPEGEAVSFKRHHPHGMVINEFANWCLSGKEPAATGEDALGEVRVALAVYRSQQSKSWESVWGGGVAGQPRANL